MVERDVFSVSCSPRRSPARRLARSPVGKRVEVFGLSDDESDHLAQDNLDDAWCPGGLDLSVSEESHLHIEEAVGAYGFARWCIRRLVATSMIATLAQACKARGHRIRVGSLCSGFDVGVLAVRALTVAYNSYVADSGGEQMRVEHAFSCEYDDAKRAVLHKIYPDCARLFKDIAQVATGQAHDEVSGCMVDVPSCDLLLAGPSCKDCSSLNNQPKALDDDSGSSCLTLTRTIKYIKDKLPKVVILENVKGFMTYRECLGASAVDWVLAELAPYGYVGQASQVNSLDFALPQCRRRVYLTLALSDWHRRR